MSDTAERVIDSEADRHPQAIQLAELASLAARIEPEILRRLRLRWLPGAHSVVEADLWFGPLVSVRAADGVTIDPQFLPALRARFMGGAGAGRSAACLEKLDAVARTIAEVHAEAPPLLLLEEQLIVAMLRDASDAEIDSHLQRVLGSVMLEPRRRSGLASWAWVALPRLHFGNRALPSLGPLVVTTSLTKRAPLGLEAAFSTGALAAVPLDFVPEGQDVTLEVRRDGRTLTLRPVSTDTPPNQRISVPDTDPRYVEVEEEEGTCQLVALPTGAERSIDVTSERLVLRDLRGRQWNVFARPESSRQAGTVVQRRSLPQAWVASILDGDRRVGLGVLVKPRHLVTCAHIVADALNIDATGPAPRASASVTVQSVRTLSVTSGRVVRWYPVDHTFHERFQDLCVLELDDDTLPDARWADLLEQEPRAGNAIRVFGYPSAPGRLSVGALLTGEVSGGWWQVDQPLNRPSFVPIGRGFSGSLAWDMAEDRAVGIVVARAAEGGAAFLIPMAVLHEAWMTADLAIQGPIQAGGRANVTGTITDATPAHDVFLCHSSADKPLVRELAAALRARRLRPWLDEAELVPGRPWQEAIENAIATTRSAAVLFGPSGIGPWADREMRAFLGEFVRRRIPVIPVLLPGAPATPALPLFLRDFTWVDLRVGGFEGEGLDRLVWAITGQRTPADSVESATPPGGRLFNLWNVPLLPDAYLPRRELGELKAALISPDSAPLSLTGQRARQAVQGMGGVGKTVLAAALARDPDVRRAFSDGVYWLTLGPTPEHPIGVQARLAAALGSQQIVFESVEHGRARLRELLADRAALLVLDDVWEAADAHPFNVVGERGRLLVTTRKGDVTRRLGAELLSLGELPADDALELLARYAGLSRSTLPAEAQAIATECGELPLALAMIGAQLHGRPVDRWKTVLARLRAADLTRLRAELPGYPHASLLAAIDVSIDDLDPTLRQRYLDLAVFAEDTPISEAALATYWAPEGLSVAEVQDTVDTFVARSLVQRDSSGRITLHDLQHDFVRARTTDGGARLDARLVAAYREAAPRGLHEGPNDGYFFERIAAHLALAEGRTALRSLLLDPRWLAAKLGVADTAGLLADFDVLEGIEADRAPRLVRDAIRLSAHILDQHPAELAGQLTGRLRGVAVGDPDLERLCTETAALAPRPTLLPLWSRMDVPGGALLRTFEGHRDSVCAVAIRGDGRTALSGSDDKTLKLWDLPTGRLLRSFEGHQDSVRAVAMSGDGKTALSGSDDKTLKLWDLPTGRLLRSFEGHQDSVRAVAMSGDGKIALSGSDDKTLKLWDLPAGRLLRSFEGHQDSVRAVAMSGDGKTALSGSDDKTLKFWDLPTGMLLRSLEDHQDSVRAVAVSGDGKTGLSGSDDKTLKLWDLSTGMLLRSLEGHQDSVRAVAMSGDGKTGLSASDDKTLKLWDLPTGMLLRSLEGHQDSVRAVAMSGDGKTGLSASNDKTLKLWDLASDKLPHALEGHRDSVNAVAVSGDGETALSGSSDTTLKLWDLATGKLLLTFEGHRDSVNAVAVSGDGETALSGSSDTTLKVWDLATGKLLRNFEGHQSPVNAMAISGDGKTALSGADDGTLKLWDLLSGKFLRTFGGHQSSVRAVAMSGDGRTALSGADDGTLKLWDLATGELLRNFEGHQSSVNAMAMSDDGRTALSGADDGTLKLWDVAGGKLLRTFGGHQSSVSAIAISGDGRTALSGSYDNTLKLWDLASGRTLASFTFDAAVLSVRGTPDGRRTVVGDALGGVHAFEMVLDT